MTAKRAVAALVAVALIVVAFVVRGALDGNDDSTADSPSTSTPTGASDLADRELICIRELAEVCEDIGEATPGLTITVEAAGTTLDRLGALPDTELPSVPRWLTVDPYPAMVDVLRQRANLEPIGWSEAALAVSPLAIAVPTGGRAETLEQAVASGPCAGDTLWACIGTEAGQAWTELDGDQAWQTVRPAFGDVPSSALGLTSFAHAVAGYFGDTTIDRGRWEADPQFIPWLRPLVRTAARTPLSGSTALATMVTRPSALDVAATAGFETGARVDVLYSEPAMSMRAVLASPTGADAPATLLDAASAGLDTAGWDDLSPDDPARASAAAMLDLRTLWQEAT